MITSTQNPKIKWVRSLQSDSKVRREENAFVVEGVRLVEEALASDWKAQWIIYSDDSGERVNRVVSHYKDQGVPVEEVSAQVMRSASDTQSPQGILAVISKQPIPLPSPLDFVLILDTMRDPGNLGTVLRAAWTAGVQAVFLSAGMVDPFSPKVLRSAMGAHFRLPIYQAGWDDIGRVVNDHNLHVFLADAGGDLAYTQADFCKSLALVIGGEAEGAGLQALQLAQTSIRIPMPGGGESLNAAIAAAVILFEIVRQRTKS